MQNSLSQFLQSKEDTLRDRWQASVSSLATKVGRYDPDSKVFQEIRQILTNLSSIVEKTGSAEQAVDALLKPIVTNLKNLQTDNQLTSTEMVFLLFLMRDTLKKILQDLKNETSGAQGPDTFYVEALDQVSSLLNRLGLVFFENAMRIKEEGFNQDILAIEYALLYERTRQIAITDRLTGLYNFGYFHERLKEERLRAERYHRLLSLVIFDIDHFKIYNDANGHPAGNEVLKTIAQILKEESRDVDIVARYGGEEMVLVLPETSRKRAVELAERIRLRISETPFEHMKSQPLDKLTVSAGVATFPVDASDEEDLVKKADNCLYQAKSQGRNLVVAFEPPLKVTLAYRPPRELSKVALVGNFNNWDKDADAMHRREDGSFQFVISLNPGIYHYKFVLDDAEWIPDPANPEHEHDTLGGENSVLHVTAK